MIERQRDAPSPGADMQDVEHDSRPATRVDNAGVEVKPRSKKPDGRPDTEAEDEHQRARDTESQIQSDVARLPPD